MEEGEFWQIYQDKAREHAGDVSMMESDNEDDEMFKDPKTRVIKESTIRGVSNKPLVLTRK